MQKLDERRSSFVIGNEKPAAVTAILRLEVSQHARDHRDDGPFLKAYDGIQGFA